MVRIRCRIGFHKWVRLAETDADLENPERSVDWRTTCRCCGRDQRSGTAIALGLGGAGVVASAAVSWFVSPLLGAIMMIGALAGVMWAAGAPVLERVLQ